MVHLKRADSWVRQLCSFTVLTTTRSKATEEIRMKEEERGFATFPAIQLSNPTFNDYNLLFISYYAELGLVEISKIAVLNARNETATRDIVKLWSTTSTSAYSLHTLKTRLKLIAGRITADVSAQEELQHMRPPFIGIALRAWLCFPWCSLSTR